jgi:hypothetical protein
VILAATLDEREGLMGDPADKRVEGLVPIYVNLTHNSFQLQDCFLYRLQVSFCL